MVMQSNPYDYKYIGKDIPNDMSRAKVTGTLRYGADARGSDTLFMRIQGGTEAHAEVLDVDTAAALALPGVVAVYTHFNVPHNYYDRGRVFPFENPPMQEQLFGDRVRFYGERIAAVVAIRPDIAEAACRLIRVTYRPLPAVFDPELALARNAPRLHETGNEVAVSLSFGEYEALAAERVDTTVTKQQRTTHLAMENHCARARYDQATQRLTIWTACQSVYGIRATLGDLLGLPYHRVQVIKNPMGGSFGCKQETILEPLVAYAALQLQADVSLVYDRVQVMESTMVKHEARLRVESKTLADGRITGLKVDCLLNSGAYQTVSPAYCRTIGSKFCRAYIIEALSYEGHAVCTNTPVGGSYRSWGSLEEATALENHVNYLARRLGKDPIELRLQQILSPGAENPLNHISLGNIRFADCLRQGRDAFDWDGKRRVLAGQVDGRYRQGIGMALGVHSNSYFGVKPEMTSAMLKMNEDASVILTCAVHDHGCGTVLTMKKIVAETLGISIDHVEMREADTDAGFYDLGCFSSRTVFVIGRAVQEASQQLMAQMKTAAAACLSVDEAELSYQDGVFSAGGRQALLKEVVHYSMSEQCAELRGICHYCAKANPGVASAHFAQVEIDVFTGHIRVTDYLAAHDIGQLINPQLCRMQIAGAVQQGLGIVRGESLVIEASSGRMLPRGMENYQFINSGDMPRVRCLFVEAGEPQGPFGAKSVGEAAIIPSVAALTAAINDALGTDLSVTPLNPEVIVAACAERGIK